MIKKYGSVESLIISRKSICVNEINSGKDMFIARQSNQNLISHRTLYEQHDRSNPSFIGLK